MTQAVSTFPKVPTNVPGLDIVTYGGLPRGRTTLITGKSGACKSILSLQLATNLAKQGMKVLLMCVEEPPADQILSGDSLGFDVSKLIADGRLKFADLTRPMEGPTFVSGDYDVAGLVHRIEAAVKSFGAQAVILDSATALFSPKPPEAYLRSHFFQIVHAFRKHDLTAVITAEAPADYGVLTTLGVEDFVCDLVLILRNVLDGERRRRTLEVHKYRRSPHYKGEYPCTITMRGITIFPLDARPRPDITTPERFSSGLQGLDDMNAGGWLRDSIILVRGPSGSGKTTLAGMYARGGAARGERVVYYGFEETREILSRNFASLGMPIEELEKKGFFKLVCRYPEATSPEDLLVDLRTGLDEFEPSLIVMDSISSIEHSTSGQGFRQFMVGVASLIREHSRSAMLTQTTSTYFESDRFAPYLSTIPDAILLMDYKLHEEDVERTMRVLKMRGSSHMSGQRRFSIGKGGIVIKA